MNAIKQRISQSQKNANDKQWYKDNIDYFVNKSSRRFIQQDVRVNYDLYNGKLNVDDFISFCNPYGIEINKKNIVHRDIVSTKIKILNGIDSMRPFEYGLVATSQDSIDRKEQLKFKKINEYVTQYIMQDVQAEVMTKYEEQFKGRKLTPDEQKQIESQIQAEIQQNTPENIDRYFKKEYKDVAEVLGEHLINYTIQKENVENKLQTALLHEALSSHGIMYIGIINDELVVKPINPLNFAYGLSSDSNMLEDAEWQVAWFDLYPSEIVKFFGNDLTTKQIDDLYSRNSQATYEVKNEDVYFDWDNSNLINSSEGTIRVYHVVWKSLMKIGFLTYVDEQTGVIGETVVPDGYKLNKEMGDIDIDWRWIPYIHEGWKYNIGEDVYLKMEPVEGQFKDLDNLYYSPMPYRGVIHDTLNSAPVSIMDRIKPYQYLYDIVISKLEKLIYSDKGKKIFMNLNMVPQSKGITLDDFLALLDNKDIGFLNPNEEGNRGDLNIASNIKEVDMSYSGDIQRYIYLAQYINDRVGESVGITKEMEGQFQNRQAVTNAQQAILQSNKILRPFFALHDILKQSVLKGILETAKVLYSTREKKSLKYITDDLQSVLINVDQFLLDSSTYDVFVNNNDKIYDIKLKIENLSQAALQNQMIDLDAILKVIKSKSLAEAQGYLTDAKNKIEKLRQQELQIAAEQAKEIENIKHKNKLDEINAEGENRLKQEKLKGEYDLQKQAMLSTGFNENKDLDKDGIPDVMEIYKKGIDAEIKQRKQKLDEEKFKHQKEVDKERLKIEKLKQENKSKNKSENKNK